MARDRLQLPWQRVIFSLAVISLLTFGGPLTGALASSRLPAGSSGLVVAQQSDQPGVTAKAAIVVDYETGTILYAKNERQRLPEASTTKVMTALLTLERGRLDDTVNVVPDDLVGESTMGLVAGETISVEMLLYGMLLPSGNDAAMALARHIGNSLPNAPGKDGVERFVALMNARAAEMGLLDTHFANPHGLDDDSHYTSARDLATITWYALRNPKFADIVSTRTRDGFGHTVYQANRLLDRYPGADGVKTGFTNNAGLCLVFSASKDGHRLIGVVLNAGQWYDDAARLLDYGFSALSTLPANQTGSEQPANSPAALALGAISHPSLLLTDLQDRYAKSTNNRIGIPLGNNLLSLNLLQSLAGTLRTSILDYRPEMNTSKMSAPGADQTGTTADSSSNQTTESVANSSSSPFLNLYTLLGGVVLAALATAGITRSKWKGPLAHRLATLTRAKASKASRNASGGSERGPLPSPAPITDLKECAQRAIAFTTAGRHREALEEFVRVISVDSKYDFGGVEGFEELSPRGFITMAVAYTACGRADYAQVLLSWTADRFPDEIQPLLARRRQSGIKSSLETSSLLRARAASARPEPRSGARAHG